jgi:hypothetical protein
MKKFFFSLLLLFGLLPLAQGQTVDSIKVEQAGDLIKIHYNILNSKPEQVFRVTVLCSINGGLQSVIKSLSGDFGDNVVGGRSEYMVLWDVLKDVDEVKSVDFSVKAELLKDNTLKDNHKTKPKWEDKKIYLMPSFSQAQDKITFGIRFAYMGQWGVSGKYVLRSFELNPTDKVTIFHTGIDLTKRLINKEKISMHLMAGFNYGAFLTGDSDGLENPITFEIGTIIAVKRIAISFAGSSYQNHFIANFGIGARF